MCPRGLEEPLAAELRAIDAGAVRPAAGGVAFEGGLEAAYRANLHSRLASRVLWRVGGGDYRSEDDLYAMAREVAWERHFGARHSLRVDVSAIRSPLRSLQFATLRIKDAVVDRARERGGTRPSIDRTRPDARVFAHLEQSRAQLYLDLSGESLFKRGWRIDKGEAPLKENLAAALLQLAGWAPARPLLDPFCGSGTIAIEAATVAIGRAPGLDRPFGFERLLSFERAAWSEMRSKAAAAVDPRAPFAITGRDISTRVIATAVANAGRAGLAEALRDGRLRFEAIDARTGGPPQPSGTIVANPPYGEQSEPKSASVAGLMDGFGTQLKREFAGWDAWMLSADRDLPRQLRLHETRKVVLFNGPIECRLFRFELVAGQYRRGTGTSAAPA